MDKVKETEGKAEPFDHDEFSESVPRDSKVIRNKNKKTISVSNAFDYNSIPIKIIAPYKEWLKFERKFFDTNKISCRDIKPYIGKRTPKNIIKALELYCKENPSAGVLTETPLCLNDFTNYCKDNPNEFTNHFYNYYICPAMKVMPLWKEGISSRPKSRGGSPYRKSKYEMYEIRNIAAHLYIFLTHWLKIKTSKWPPIVNEFFNKYQISNTSTQSEAISITMSVIEKRFGINVNRIDDLKTFYDKYIAFSNRGSNNKKRFDIIRKALEYVNYEPTRYPLSMLCKNFQSCASGFLFVTYSQKSKRDAKITFNPAYVK